MENANLWNSTIVDSSYIKDALMKSIYITISIGSNADSEKTMLLAKENQVFYFGTAKYNDIPINSSLVSERHGALCYRDGRWFCADVGSVYGIQIDSTLLHSTRETTTPEWHEISIPCILRISPPNQNTAESVEITIDAYGYSKKERVMLRPDAPCIIGRAPGCEVCIPHVTVSRLHAIINYANGSYYIDDYRSTNGLTVNSQRINGKTALKMHDVIRIGRTMIIFMGTYLEIVRANTDGVSIVARGINKYVYERKGLKKKKKKLLNNVSLNIKPGELVAIIGGSGAGKTTLLNVLSKFTSKQDGSILIDGQNLDYDYASIKDMIGYVPQQDIVYEQLPLWKMLDYAARMRMPNDTTPEERKRRISEVLELVQLQDHQKTLISKLSGGQKKRASIAVELLADPSLFFLDEPTSGLDAGTEEKLMHSLQQLAKSGKTVILVTHSTLKLDICDRIIAMGKGGKLCFSGTLHEAKAFFQVEEIPDIYDKLDNESAKYEQLFRQSVHNEAPSSVPVSNRNNSQAKNGISGLKQYQILTSRYAQIMMRNKKQLLGIIGQALVFAFILVLVSKGDLYVEFKGTQTVNFVTASLGMWMGLFLAIQEITKERSIVRREYMANLKRLPYLLSKVTVLGVLSAIQTIILQLGSYVFSTLLDKNLPDNSLLLPCYIENGISVFWVCLASVCMGLTISALSKQPEKSAPYVLMPQIVLSGVLFELGGAFDYLKWLVFTYWGNRALCISADVNALGERQMGMHFTAVEDYTSTVNGLLCCWGALILLAALMILIAYFALAKLRKDER